jgi:ribosomal protein L11 methyltransferase
MKWFEIKVITTQEASDAVTEMLTVAGAGGTSIEDPNDIRQEILKPNTLDYADEEFLDSLGEDVVIKAYFHGDNNIEELTSLIKEKIKFIGNFLNVGKGYEGYTEVDDEDWGTSWKKYYKPLHLTDKLVIKPSWESYDKSNEEIIIELDPGMAFGTGTHETTRMCAVLLEKYMKKGDRIIDVGCGTGILAIIAAKLGASFVTAVDIDEVAVRVAKENIQINNATTSVNVQKGVLNDIEKEEYDIITANIIADVIIDVSGSVSSYLKKGGLLITSGIIKERSCEVIDAYEKKGFLKEEVQELGEWVAIVFKCLGSL